MTSSSSSATTSSVLPPEPLSVQQMDYDFEEFAIQHGIPATLDPLPYRKEGSVFSGETAVLTSAKHDPRLRTVVCRHWLRDLCMKGSACEFLHEFDLSKMPLCRHGEDCQIRNCPFRHISEANRMECVFYCQGFCIHGNFCRYKHIRRERVDLPLVADFTLGLVQMQAAAGEVVKRTAPKPNEFYKISLCKHFLAGQCPFDENCHFAHGEHELRKFPTKDEEGGASALTDSLFANTNTTTSTADYFQGGASGGGKPNPILEPDQAIFIVVAAATQDDLCESTVRGEWYVEPAVAELIAKNDKAVLLFFTVAASHHIQGAALVKQNTSAPQPQTKNKNNKGRIEVEWYRTTELPISVALKVAPDLILPTPTQAWSELPTKVGDQLAKALWNSPLVTLYESIDENPVTDVLADFRAPKTIGWPTRPGPGFIFGCSSDTMDECLGRGIFGLPLHMQASAQQVRPGSTIFLFNVTDRLLFGIFEALTSTRLNIEPTAFSKNPQATESPFPVQIRVRVALECPPLEDVDAADILRRTGRMGPVTHAQAQALATLLAMQCGALEYMQDYQRHGRSPPIALPPRKIQR